MRLMFFGTRFFGIRPGISFNPNELRARLQPTTVFEQLKGCFVYVISNEQGQVKIGITSDPFQRLASLQTGSHSRLKFEYIGVCDKAGYMVEQVAHQMLAQHRLEGEWFAVSPAMAVAAVSGAAHQANVPIVQLQEHMVPQLMAEVARQTALERPQSGKTKTFGFGFVVFAIVFWLIVGFIVLVANQ
jgi:hypothetical protein